MSGRTFNFLKPLELPHQLHWKRADERELLGWTIRARNYNTFVANCMFGFMALLAMGATWALYPFFPSPDDFLSNILISASFFTVSCSTVLSMTHQRVNFAYRFTHSGLEFCEWKDFPKWALPFLRWMMGITAIIFLFLATTDPSFLIGALVGPGGMGLMYLQMAYSKNFRAMHTRYHHHDFDWDEFTQLAIATNREIVDLKYKMILDGDTCETEWNINLYCKRNQKEPVAEFIAPYLRPDVPSIRAKVNVPMSTD
jgi:putative Mn2+ efflux pump MntP